MRPVVGADKVARFLFGALDKVARLEQRLTVSSVTVNGNPALLLILDDEYDGILAARVEGTRIAGLYYVRNPEKLSHLDAETELTLH
jgi:RNA polymerase sigma-70 factor (ECF subfamily)